jgi:hypothetical protein
VESKRHGTKLLRKRMGVAVAGLALAAFLVWCLVPPEPGVTWRSRGAKRGGGADAMGFHGGKVYHLIFNGTVE